MIMRHGHNIVHIGSKYHYHWMPVVHVILLDEVVLMWRLASALIDRAKDWLQARPTAPVPSPPLPPQTLPNNVVAPPVFPAPQPPRPANPASEARNRVAMQREAVRNVRLKLETFLASLEGLEDEPLIKAIHHFERYGYSKVSGVPRIDIPLRRDHYDHDHLMEMKDFIEAKCAILLRICDREELQLELKHPSNLIGADLDELTPATPEQLKDIVDDLTKEIDHLTRTLVQEMDPRLLG